MLSVEGENEPPQDIKAHETIQKNAKHQQEGGFLYHQNMTSPMKNG